MSRFYIYVDVSFNGYLLAVGKSQSIITKDALSLYASAIILYIDDGSARTLGSARVPRLLTVSSSRPSQQCNHLSS